MLIVLLVFAFLAFAWSILVIADCVRRRSGVWEQYRAELENRQARYTIVMVVSGLVLGLCLERLLP